ncbi:MAG: 50S ribosomal protein L11 methyltransferase, partial [Bacteroidota bacterium]
KGAKHVTAIDINEWAYNNTLENIEKNNCADIKVLQGDASLLKNQNYDIILANINRNILMSDISKYAKALNQKGILLLSGLYKDDLTMIKNEAADHNLTFNSFKEKHNWVAAIFYKD